MIRRGERVRGAVRPRVPVGTRLKSYLARHLETCTGSLKRLTGQPGSTLMTVAVIAIALAMPVALHVLVVNAKSLGGRWENVADLSVYLEPGTGDDAVAALATQIGARDDVAAVEPLTADEALVEFRALSGFGAALDALTENPLPPLLIVRPTDETVRADAVGTLAEALRSVDGVDLVQSDTAWVERFNAIVDLVRRMVLLAAILLAGAVVVIVGNTIRLDIQNRRDEIEITRLIGASDGFVRQPFLYTGAWFGLAGGIGALILIELSLALLAGPVARIAGLYGSGFTLAGPDARAIVALVAGGAALGWLGSWIAATRHMRAMNPI